MAFENPDQWPPIKQPDENPYLWKDRLDAAVGAHLIEMDNRLAAGDPALSARIRQYELITGTLDVILGASSNLADSREITPHGLDDEGLARLAADVFGDPQKIHPPYTDAVINSHEVEFGVLDGIPEHVQAYIDYREITWIANQAFPGQA